MLTFNDLGKGTPVVLIHGLGSKKEAWVPQHDLANNCRLIIPDLRGHGETVMDKNLSIKNFALDVIDLLKHLKINSAFICGLSLGGIVALELYRQCPEMVRGLILSNTTFYIPAILGNRIIRESNLLLQKGENQLVEHIVSTGLYDKSYTEEAKKAFHIRDSYLDSAKATIGANYSYILPTIRKPVLLIGSTHDKVTPSINMFLMSSFIRRAQTALLKNAGHLSNIEKKDLFNQHVRDFITAHSA
jgi:3-oxoadipate enol-lactonase